MTEPLKGTWLPKNSEMKVCTCGVVIVRGWQWSEKEGRNVIAWYDCESAGHKRPTTRLGGTGQLHVHTEKKSA